MIYSCNFSIIRFYFLFSTIANGIRDSQRFFPCYPHIIKLYALYEGLGVFFGGGVVDGISLDLAGGICSSGEG